MFKIIKIYLTKWGLIALNVLLFVLLIILWNQYQLSNKKLNSIHSSQNSNYSYTDNPNYWEQLNLDSLYKDEYKIVLLGNSLTYKVNWNELLNRQDVSNRGIGSDITEGYVNRLNKIISLKPSIVFIEGGINDVALNIEPSKIILHFHQLVDSCLQHKITPVLHTILPVHELFPDAYNINLKVWLLNKVIRNYASQKKISLIDLTPFITSQGFLKSEFAQKDAIHLKANAYKIWATQIQITLQSIQ